MLLLADRYPQRCLETDEVLLEEAAAKHLRLYVEFPESLPGLTLGEPRAAQWERAVVSSEFFAPELHKHAILAIHGCRFLPTEATAPHLVLARVAGYRHAVYGLPTERFPILFELPGQPVMVATTALSRFVTARYGPAYAWKAVWQTLLRWLSGERECPALEWSPTVRVQAGPEEALPPTAEADARRRSVRWFGENVVYSVSSNKSAIEGFGSKIDADGRQMQNKSSRADCIAETAMVFAYDAAVEGNRESGQTACALLDYVWSAPDFLQDDAATPMYGLINWNPGNRVYYGDDDARVILPTLVAGRLLDDPRWDERVLRCTLANLRLTGTLGFRKARFDYPDDFTEARSWQYYHDTEHIHYAPHYQAYLWACFLWAYALTGYEGFLSRTKNAIRMTMQVYPKLQWTNGLTQEMARLLLPLAFLVRVEDSREHRTWLRRVADDLLAEMQSCGAIRERLGPLEDGSYPSPRSNEQYGTREASVIQENGDPACDLLYTTNYAFLGLHEAAGATADPNLREAEDRLAQFLCRVQVRSQAHRYLDGAWMRSFDYALWEYWGSSADLGWGAWAVESGWTNTWIASVLAMRATGEYLFDLTTADQLRAKLPALLQEMLG